MYKQNRPLMTKTRHLANLKYININQKCLNRDCRTWTDSENSQKYIIYYRKTIEKMLESEPCLPQIWIGYRPQIYLSVHYAREDNSCVLLYFMLYNALCVYILDACSEAWIKSRWNCILLQWYGLKLIKPR